MFISHGTLRRYGMLKSVLQQLKMNHFTKKVRTLISPGWREVQPKKSDAPEGWGELKNSPCQGFDDFS